MSATAQGSVRRRSGELIAGVDELDRTEREALARDDWLALEQVLEGQKRFWQRLARLARDGEDEATRAEATAGLRRLYETRVRNHPVIEQKTEELRARLIQVRRTPVAGRVGAAVDIGAATFLSPTRDDRPQECRRPCKADREGRRELSAFSSTETEAGTPRV